MRLVRLGLTAASFCLSVSASALTPGQAYHKAAQFLRAQGTAGWASAEAQPVLLGEAVGGDPLAAGPRSTTLLASLELGSVDARARRARALGSLGLAASADTSALLAIATATTDPGFGVDANHLGTPLDTSLALQALDATGLGGSSVVVPAANDLVSRQLASGLWALLRKADAAGGGAIGDVGTTAQAVLALKPRQSTYATDFDQAATALRTAAPTRASDRALRVLALLEWNSTHADTSSALTQLVAMQIADGSFGTESLAVDRVYATALAARAIKRAGTFSNFAFDSDGDGTADGPDLDSDNDGICDPGESGAGCTGSDVFPTDPAEAADLDKDGIGNNADLDDDGDGIADASEPGFGGTAQEHANTDGDALADTADPDDDNDGLLDVDELLAGLDPRDVDTDGDHFRDNTEIAKSRDPLNKNDVPLPPSARFRTAWSMPATSC